MRKRTSVAILSASLLFLTLFCTNADAKIEAVKGKKYSLTKKHGPWMIMVATFRLPHKKAETTEGINPKEAAEELVYFLRKRGIPAYSFTRNRSIKDYKTRDRLGREENRLYLVGEEVCVIAGNYSTTNNTVGRQTLAYVKKLKPKFLDQGGIFRSTPGRPGPFSGAMLTINPLLNPQDVMSGQRNAYLAKLNSGVDHSLYENKGKYTVRVASYTGKSATRLDNSAFTKTLEAFTVKSLHKKMTSLDQADEDAKLLTQELRKRKIDAYMYKTRNESIVCIGAFDSANDPQIKAIQKKLTAQWKQDPKTGKTTLLGEAIPVKIANNRQKWLLLDPQPRLMPVPKF